MNPASIARKLFGEHRGASRFFFLFLRYFIDFRLKLLYLLFIPFQIGRIINRFSSDMVSVYGVA